MGYRHSCEIPIGCAQLQSSIGIANGIEHLAPRHLERHRVRCKCMGSIARFTMVLKLVSLGLDVHLRDESRKQIAFAPSRIELCIALARALARSRRRVIGTFSSRRRGSALQRRHVNLQLRCDAAQQFSHVGIHLLRGPFLMRRSWFFGSHIRFLRREPTEERAIRAPLRCANPARIELT